MIRCLCKIPWVELSFHAKKSGKDLGTVFLVEPAHDGKAVVESAVRVEGIT